MCLMHVSGKFWLSSLKISLSSMLKNWLMNWRAQKKNPKQEEEDVIVIFLAKSKVLIMLWRVLVGNFCRLIPFYMHVVSSLIGTIWWWENRTAYSLWWLTFSRKNIAFLKIKSYTCVGQCQTDRHINCKCSLLSKILLWIIAETAENENKAFSQSVIL